MFGCLHSCRWQVPPRIQRTIINKNAVYFKTNCMCASIASIKKSPAEKKTGTINQRKSWRRRRRRKERNETSLIQRRWTMRRWMRRQFTYIPNEMIAQYDAVEFNVFMHAEIVQISFFGPFFPILMPVSSGETHSPLPFVHAAAHVSFVVRFISNCEMFVLNVCCWYNGFNATATSTGSMIARCKRMLRNFFGRQ